MLPIFPPQTWFDSENDMHRIMMMIMYDDGDNNDDSDDDTDDDDSVNFNFRADHRAHIVKVVWVRHLFNDCTHFYEVVN